MRSAPSVPTDRSSVLIARYRSILENSPGERFALERFFALHRERDGSLGPLRQSLETEAAAEPDALFPKLMLGEVFVRIGDESAAEAAFHEAARIAPEAAAPAIALARLSGRLYRRGERSREVYRAELTSAVEKTTGELRREFLEALAAVALDAGDIDAAEGHFRTLSASRDASIHERSAFARALMERGMHDRAVGAYDALLRQLRGDPRVLPPVLRDAARARRLSGDVPGARRDLERALALSQRAPGLRREIYDELAELHRGADDLRGLIDVLGRRRDPEAGRMVARLWDELGEVDEALAAYRRVLRSAPRDLDARIRVVQLLTRGGQLDAVVEEYRGLIRMAPREGRFVQELAQLLVQLGRREEAQGVVAQAFRRHRRDATMLGMLLQVYNAWEETEKAEEVLRQLLRIQPNDPSNIIALGQREFEAGRRDAALQIWRRLLRINASPGEGHGMLAELLVEQAMFAEAEEHYRRALAASPDNVLFLRGLAHVLEQTGVAGASSSRREEALRLWAQVRDQASGPAAEGARREARRRIVGVHRRSGNLAGQIGRWRQAFAAEPADTEAGRLLVEAYWTDANQRDALIAVLERLLVLGPGDLDAMLTLERFHTLAGDLGRAIDVLERLVSADPSHAARYFDRMAAHAMVLYRDADALRFSREAVRRDPEDAERHRRLGDLYRAQQQPRAALASYEDALARNDRLFPTYIAVAELQAGLGDVAAAAAAYEQVLLRSPDDELAGAAARQLMSIVTSDEQRMVSFEGRLLAEVLRQPRRALLRRTLVELYGILAPLVDEPEAQGQLGRRALKPLLESLVDDYPGMRDTALEVLRITATPQAAEALLSLAEGNARLPVRAKALLALGGLALEQESVRRLAALATGTAPGLLRLRAVWVLASGRGENPAAARELENALLEIAEGGDSHRVGYAMLGLARRAPSRRGAQLRSDRFEAALGSPNASLRAVARLAQAIVDLEAQGSSGTMAGWAAVFGGGVPEEIAVAAVVLGQDPWAEAPAHLLGEHFFSPNAEVRSWVRGAFSGRFRAMLHRDWPLPAPANSRSLGGLWGLAAGDAGETLSWLTDVPLPVVADALDSAIAEGLMGPPEIVSQVLRFLAPPAAGLPLGLGELSLRYAEWPPAVQERYGELCGILRGRVGEHLTALRDNPSIEIRRLAARRLMGVGADAAAWRRWLADPQIADVLVSEIAPAHRTPELIAELIDGLANSEQWAERWRLAQALRRLRGARPFEGADRARLQTLADGESHALVREALGALLSGA